MTHTKETNIKKTRGKKVNSFNLRSYWAELRENRMDSIIFVMVILLVIVGIVMIYSSSYYEALARGRSGGMLHFTIRQSAAAIVGLGIMLFAAFFKYEWLKPFIPIGYMAACAMVAFASLRGSEIRGARRWFDLTEFGIPISFQPSEFAMVMLVLMLALYLSKRAKELDLHIEKRLNREAKRSNAPTIERLRKKYTNSYNLRSLLGSAAIIGLPLILVHMGRNTTTVIIITIVGSVVVFISSKLIAPYVIAGVAFIAAGGLSAYYLAIIREVEGNTFGRIRMFLGASDEAVFQTEQSLIAVGSGGMFGLGLGQSLQKFGTLPLAHNDFIFAIIIEELGLFGAGIILFLFGVLIWRGIVAARNAKNLFGTLIAAGAVTLIAVQVLVGVGVAVDAIPNTGSPIPFISYGGTSVLFNLALVGVLLNVSRYTKEPSNIDSFLVMPHRRNNES